MKARVGASMFVLFSLLVALTAHPAWSADPTGTDAALGGEAQAKSLTEVNKQLTNSEAP
jgi:hypothetical protein